MHHSETVSRVLCEELTRNVPLFCVTHSLISSLFLFSAIPTYDNMIPYSAEIVSILFLKIPCLIISISQAKPRSKEADKVSPRKRAKTRKRIPPEGGDSEQQQHRPSKARSDLSTSQANCRAGRPSEAAPTRGL